MKHFNEFLATVLATVLAVLLSALCTYWAWNEVSYLFPALPATWQHLSFMQCLWLTWLLRIVTAVIRFDVERKT